MKKSRDIQGQPRVRSGQALAAWDRNGGPMGGTRKQQHKRSRKAVKLDLKGQI